MNVNFPIGPRRLALAALVTLFCLPAAQAAGPTGVNRAIVYQQALDRAEKLISNFEEAVSKGAEGPMRDAALRLQRDPLAVLTVNQTGSSFLREHLNMMLDTTKARARDLARQQIADHYGVSPEEVSFFEATNTSPTVKVGQDWDVTVRVRGIDVPVKVAKPVIEGAYYESVHGVPAPDAATAHAFAHDHAIEVINYKGTEAYGYSNTEGGRIINGPKDQGVRDPGQVGNAVEVKSNLPRERAMALEAGGTHEGLLDAQGQWTEEMRQYAKQYGKQVKARVEAMGGKVPEHIAYGSEIMEEFAAGKITLPEAVALLDQIGETPQSLISKGAKLVESAQTLKAPGTGAAALDVLPENVEGQIKLKQLEEQARAAKAASNAPETKPAGTPETKPAGARERTGSTPETAPASAEVGGKIPSAGKVAEGVGAGLTLVNLFLDYQACLQEGRNDCIKELTFAAGQIGVIGGVGTVSAQTLLAWGVSEATLTAASAGLAAIGIPIAVFGVYKAGERWANAPETQALAGLRQEQKNLLTGYGRMQQEVETRLYNLQGLRARSAALCDQIGMLSQEARDYDAGSREVQTRLQALLPSLQQATAGCDQGKPIAADIDALQNAVLDKEGRVTEAFDRANALADQCRGKPDADQIVQLYNDGEKLAASMQVDAARARGRSDRLEQLAAGAADAKTRYDSALEMRDQLSNYNARVERAVATALANRDKRTALAATAASEQQAIAARLKKLAFLMPKQAPSPVFQQEFEEAKAKQAFLADTLADASGDVACANGLDAALLLKLQSQQRLGTATTSVNGLSGVPDACNAVVGRSQTADEIAASANWALAAVGINDTLPQRAAACITGTGGIAGGPALPRCPDNSGAVWNPSNQQMQCRCNAGYKIDGTGCIADKKPEPLNIACNTASKAGANPPETINVAVGRAQGTAQFNYDMYVEPDQMIVRYGGQILLDTGCVSGSKAVPLALNGSSDQVTVSVKPSCRGNGATTKWTFTLSCPVAGKPGAGVAPSTDSAWLPGNAPAKGDFGPLVTKSVTGNVRYAVRSSPDFRPLTDPGAIQPGISLQLERDASVVLSSRGATQVTLNGNSEATLGELENGRQVVLLQSGSLEVKHVAIRSEPDRIWIRTEQGSVHGEGTHYRVERTWRGTEVRVFEGSVRLTGDYIIRTYASNADAGKPSPVQEMRLAANQQALMASIAFKPAPTTLAASPATAPATAAAERIRPPDDIASRSRAVITAPAAADPARTVPAQGSSNTSGPVLTDARLRPGDDLVHGNPTPAAASVQPWDQAQMQQWIDEWLRQAIPVVDEKLPGPWRYSEWAQVLGPGSRAAGAPDHPAGWSRYRSLWSKRDQFTSRNLCTMGEFIERRSVGKGLADCDKRAVAVPAWVASPPAVPLTAQAPGAGKADKTNKADKAIEAARTEVAQNNRAAPPSWLAPAASAQSGTGGQRAANAIAAARIEANRTLLAPAAPAVAPVVAPVAPAVPSAPARAAVDFSGNWACTLTDARGDSAMFPTISRVGNGYRVSTITSGELGMIDASNISAEGNQIRIVHQVPDGSITLQLARNGNTLSGGYLARWNNGRQDSIPMRCELQAAAPAVQAAPPTVPQTVPNRKK